jgi:hypothetical protein
MFKGNEGFDWEIIVGEIPKLKIVSIIRSRASALGLVQVDFGLG